MELCWGYVGAMLEHLGAVLQHLTSTCVVKALILKKCQKCNTYHTFGTSEGCQGEHFAAKLEHFGVMLDHVGAFCGYFGVMLGHVGAFWSQVEAFGNMFDQTWDILEPS